ncbi:sugar phosphate isomerase/epimerase [Paraburkholderia sp. DHOC27]|uniref:sugar phosphate isomerase/epimerase family protein n=1 Tax=Paraburkholderia sp. DHOC27 TaxID=2303330 RepID=UPI000E3D8730|nr:TIM barrel protein [Paraburkholderia sp. DHOC27]RFU45317.1 sugar phosphate isomerase/epimerase [Paraburkholderia sp. DHOC27]
MPEVVIVASAFGADAIRRDGHAAWLSTAADAGAAGFEVRRELFASGAEAGLPALRSLGASIAALGLWAVYSTPATLFDPQGALDEPALRLALDEAEALGARFVKLQLGALGALGGADTHVATAHGTRIAACVEGCRARLVVENGQLPEGGLIRQFAALFDALQREGHAGVLGMTFDMGNWQWPGESPVAAARQLAKHVEYIHCKAVVGSGARRFAAAPAADDPVCADLLPCLPQSVPRGIEFPFDPSRMAADAAHYVAWLGGV